MFTLGMALVCFGPKAVRKFRISPILGADLGVALLGRLSSLILSLCFSSKRWRSSCAAGRQATMIT